MQAPEVTAERADAAQLAVSRSRGRRTRARTWRRATAIALLLVPTAAMVLADFGRRSERLMALSGEYRWTYVAAVAESLFVWGLLLYAASRRRGALRWVAAVLFVFALTFTYGGQKYFFDQYNAYLNVDVSLFASNFKDSVINQLFADIGNYLWAKLPPFLVAIGLIFVSRRMIRPPRLRARVAGVLAPLLLIGAFFIPTQHRHIQASTPDVLYLNAVGGLIRTQLGLTDQSNQMRPRARQSLPVPALRVKGGPQRNVVYVLLESVRADATCIEFDPACQRTGSSNRLMPERFPFTQMRSMASCTAISLAVTWSGLAPNEDRDTLHTWPLVFDYARAAGYDTAYWTSQNMLFGNARLWVKNLGVSSFVSATELEPTSDLDMGAPEGLLADHVNEQIGKLKEPFFAVVHFSNVHYPYHVDADLPQPFQPATTSKAPDQNGSFFNHYQNSVYQQDMHLARILERIRNSDLGKRTAIVYTSDHGEAFREHGQMGHTFSIFDEEIHVPTWIWAPPGILTEAQKQSLAKKRDDYVYHVDVAPTLIDLLGVWDDPGLDKYKTKMPGHSLLRPELTTQALPMTNCAGVWSCAFENWGYMKRNMKLEARAWDTGFHCYDVQADPLEQTNLGLEACSELHQRTLETFGRLPGRKK
ncbi:MAG: LTA synthase family protein [Polyangiaceae bacterium]